jgi:hypothetical protein
LGTWTIPGPRFLLFTAIDIVAIVAAHTIIANFAVVAVVAVITIVAHVAIHHILTTIAKVAVGAV